MRTYPLGDYLPNGLTEAIKTLPRTDKSKNIIFLFINRLYLLPLYTMFLPYMSPTIAIPSKAFTSILQPRANCLELGLPRSRNAAAGDLSPGVFHGCLEGLILNIVSVKSYDNWI